MLQHNHRRTARRLLSVVPLTAGAVALTIGTAHAEETTPQPVPAEIMLAPFDLDDPDSDDGHDDPDDAEDDPWLTTPPAPPEPPVDPCEDDGTIPGGPSDLLAPGSDNEPPQPPGNHLVAPQPTDPECPPEPEDPEEPEDGPGSGTGTKVPTRIDAGAAPIESDHLALGWLLGGGALVTASGAAFARTRRTDT